MSVILAPAVRLAEEGFPVAPLTALGWQQAAQRQLSTSLGGQEMTLAGRGPHPGEIFRNPGLARTLRKVAEGGKTAYYQGEIAEAIASTIQQAGGCMTVEDLAKHTSTWEQPIPHHVPGSAHLGMPAQRSRVDRLDRAEHPGRL